MKILMCCGSSTQKIVEGLQAKFKTGGIDFIMVESIAEIEDIYTRGEYFDRAIILEHSWTDSFSVDITEAEIRDNLNKFVNLANKRHKNGMQYVFLASNDIMANIVSEEIMPIANNSAILVKAPPYYVQFFGGMVTYDIHKFPPEIVYKPEIIEDTSIQTESTKAPESRYAVIEEDDMSKAPYTEPIIHQSAKDAPKDTVGSWDDTIIDTALPYDSGENDDTTGEGIWDDDKLGEEPVEDPGEETVEEPWDDTGDEPWDGDFDPELTGDSGGYTDPGITTDVSVYDDDEDAGIRVDDIEPYDGDTEATPPDNGIPGFDESMYEPTETTEPEAPPPEYSTIHDNIKTVGSIDTKGLFDDEDYTRKPEVARAKHTDDTDDPDDYVQPDTRRKAPKANIGSADVKATLDAFASRGNSIVLTGMGGCGTSTIAFNIANTLSNIGYSVLLVDMDTIGKTQSYISKDNYECINSEPDSANLRAALNSTSGISSKVAIVRPGFHLLTMGLGGDTVELATMIDRSKLVRFANLSKSSYNFIVYDIPFKDAVGAAQDITATADNIITVVDSSNWGITKAMVGMCNIPNEDMEDVVLSRGQLLFNRYTGFTKVMGKKVRSAADVVKIMDFMVRDLVGEEPDYCFSNMHICGVLNYDKSFESGWYSDVQYSDTKAGQALFLELIKGIVFKR